MPRRRSRPPRPRRLNSRELARRRADAVPTRDDPPLWRRWIGFVLLPLLCGIAIGAATWWLLSVETAPTNPPALGFDVPHNPELEELAFRLFGAYGRLGARDEFRPASSVDVPDGKCVGG